MLNVVLWAIAVNTTALVVISTRWYRTIFKLYANDVPIRSEIVLKAEETNQPLYYFGVGSNMLRSKVEGRSIDGSPIELISIEPAMAPGYRLAFNSRAFPPLEPAMASIEPVQSDATCWKDSGALHSNADITCHGALIKLHPQQYEKIWKSEGGGVRAQSYEEIVVEVFPYSRKNGEVRSSVKAVALTVRTHNRLRSDWCPSVRYMKLLCQGAAELGLQKHYRDWLESHPVDHVPWIVKKVAIYNLALSIMLQSVLHTPVLMRFLPWLLGQVYVPSTRPRIQRLMSEFAMVYILLPGSILGFLVRNFMYIADFPPHPLLKNIELSS